MDQQQNATSKYSLIYTRDKHGKNLNENICIEKPSVFIVSCKERSTLEMIFMYFRYLETAFGRSTTYGDQEILQ